MNQRTFLFLTLTSLQLLSNFSPSQLPPRRCPTHPILQSVKPSMLHHQAFLPGSNHCRESLSNHPHCWQTVSCRFEGATEDPKPSRNHIEKLPVELFTEIMKTAVQETNATPLTFSHVCKQWRTVINNNPYGWDVLVLTNRRPSEKAKLWLDKSKGKLWELTIRASVMNANETRTWTRLLRDMDWSRLRVFKVQGWKAVKFLQRIGKLDSLTNLESLEIDNVNPLCSFPSILYNSQQSTLRELSVLRVPQGRGRRLPFQVSHLTSLTLYSVDLPGKCLFTLFKANPRLEHVSFERVKYGKLSTMDTGELCYLKSLHLVDNFPYILCTVAMPALEVLKIENSARLTVLFLEGLTAGNKSTGTRLTEISLRSCPLPSPDALISLLRISPNLRKLEVSNVGVGTMVDDITAVVDTLAATYLYPPIILAYGGYNYKQYHTNSKAPVCPNLTHVDFSGCAQVQPRSIMRMVHSRLGPEVIVVPQSEEKVGKGWLIHSTPPAPRFSEEIIALRIDRCPLVGPISIQWLLRRVPYLSY